MRLNNIQWLICIKHNQTMNERTNQPILLLKTNKGTNRTRKAKKLNMF